MNCTPASLVQASKCFCGIRPSDARRSIIYALCQWANAGVLCRNSFIVDPPPPIARVDAATETLGFTFQVSTGAIVTRLGRYYVPGNAQNHFIRLWSNTGPTSLANGTILASSTSDARGFKWVDVTPVTLTPGNGYTIGVTENPGGDVWKDSWPLAGFIDPIFTSYRACFIVASDTFPSNLVALGESYSTPAMCFEETFPCGAPSIYLEITGASDPNADGIYVNWSPILWVGPSYVIGPFISSYTIEFTGAQWELIQHHSLTGDETLYISTTTDFPCLWTPSPFSIPPAPTGQYIPALPPPPAPVPPTLVVIDDGGGGLWRMIVDTTGNVGAESTLMPATPDIILNDHMGGYWRIIVDTSGNLGTVSNPGPATPAPTLDDGFGGFWRVIADSSGNIGAEI